jgi:hypothetical protein
MDKKIEHIIRTKTYLELSERERNEIEEWVQNEEEYNQLKRVFHSTDLFKEELQEDLNPTIKQRLDVRFKEKFDKRRLVWYNRLWLFLWPSETNVVRKPLFQLAAVGIAVALVTPFLFQNGINKQQLALKEKSVQEEALPVKEQKLKKSTEAQGEEAEEVLSKEEEVVETVSVSKDEVIEQRRSNIDEILVMSDAEVTENDMLHDEKLDIPQVDSRLVDQVSSTGNSSATAPLESFRDEESDKSVFAGAAGLTNSKDFDSLNEEAEDRGSVNKVDTEKTLDLLTALY